MGDVADMILEGILCESCGVYIDSEGIGHPRQCNECQSEDWDQEKEDV